MEAVTFLGLIIHKEEQFDWVDGNEIPEMHQPLFWSWMKGQTAPLIQDTPGAVYRHDFERWYRLKFHGEPTYFD